MAIDMHSHWYPDALVEAMMARERLPHVRPGEGGRHVVSYQGMSTPVRPGYTDFDRRIATMAAAGVTAHVISLGNRMLNALMSLSAEDAAPLCRIFNDGVSALALRHPGRVYGLAMLPYAEIAVAVEEFDRALGLPGVIGAILPGNGFRDRARAEPFLPVLAAAQAAGGAHFLVHDGLLFDEFGEPGRTPADNVGLRKSTLDTQNALSDIMVTLNLTDILDPFPGVTVQVHNLGGNLPMEISRMDHLYLFLGTGEALPSSRCRRTLVDCNSLGAGAIKLGVALYGADRIMLGTDGSEFGAEWSRRAVAEARIADSEREAILAGTAARLLPGLAVSRP